MRRRASAKKKKQKKADDSDEFGDDQVIVQPKPPCFISLEDETHEEVEVTKGNKVRPRKKLRISVQHVGTSLVVLLKIL